jgi:hypothetical protein
MNFIIGNHYQVEFVSEWKNSVYEGIWKNRFESDKTITYIFMVTEYHRVYGSYQFRIYVKADEVGTRVRLPRMES